MKLITLSGLDGSGKSTQLGLLKKHLEDGCQKVFYFHAVNFGLAQHLVDFRNKYCLLCRLAGSCKTKHSGTKSVTRANRWQILLRKIFLRIDIFRFRKLYDKLQKSGFDYILSDRYFYDTVINIFYLERLINKNIGDPRDAIRAIPAPDMAFYLSADPKAIMGRERVPDQGADYLRSKKELYDKLAPQWGLLPVDGNRPTEEIFADILSRLPKKY